MAEPRFAESPSTIIFRESYLTLEAEAMKNRINFPVKAANLGTFEACVHVAVYTRDGTTAMTMFIFKEELKCFFVVVSWVIKNFISLFFQNG